MKNILLIISLSLSCFGADAQRPRTRHDTLLVGFAAASNDLLTGDVVQGIREPAVLYPVRTRFCFDETINVEIVTGSGRLEQALFINNDQGYMGFTRPGVNGRGAIDMIMPEVPDFTLCVFGFKGNIYTYHNKKGNNPGDIQHEVMTGNTQTFKYQIAESIITAPLSRKGEQRTYCEGQATATAYKLPDLPTLWFLYGDRYPAVLHVRKYFGAFGIGVVHADEGNYVVMEVVAGQNDCIIKHIDKMQQCFDPNEFHMVEDEFRAKRRTELEAERAKIEQHAADAANARICGSERMAIVNFEREQNRLAFRYLDSTEHGNIYQDRTTQKAYMNMMDPLVLVQGAILACNNNICGCREGLSRQYSAATEERLNCLQTQLARLQSMLPRMREFERQYPDNPAAANAKKSQLYMTEMRNVCN